MKSKLMLIKLRFPNSSLSHCSVWELQKHEMCQVMSTESPIPYLSCYRVTEPAPKTSKFINVSYCPYDLYRKVVEDYRGRLWVQTSWYVISTAQQPLGLKEAWEWAVPSAAQASQPVTLLSLQRCIEGSGRVRGLQMDEIIAIPSLNDRVKYPWWTLVVVAEGIFNTQLRCYYQLLVCILYERRLRRVWM